MAKVEILKPVDQAVGKRRLLNELKADLASTDFQDFRIVVAYAKSGPLHRLRGHLEKWSKKGCRVRAIIGIDQQGTSREALEFALAMFDEVYVTRERGITFHPKAYIFEGPALARIYVGSNNLTVGGTETNFEAAVRVCANLPADAAVLQEMEALWDQLLPANCAATKPLDLALLNKLVADGHVLGEAAMRKALAKGKSSTTTATKTGLPLQPASPLPPGALANPKAAKAASTGTPTATVSPTSSAAPTVSPAQANGFAIQIKPHHNGEIFLSVSAALQNPAFFEFPFNGMTTPKSTGNPYPQRVPDPVVNIHVYGAGRALVLSDEKYRLNTVYYERKSEIRITASRLVGTVPDYSVMVMTPGEEPGVDYEITIHRPDSPDYGAWVAACNQQMPGGGQTPRRFGWF
ncbi:phospholipase D-like domain-containing protein [Phenylobacterium sp.]|uniref:phospholipase D-like domain-containing protein n=1 Tax=Phenylobacterium sp. TaxID=1871053 RepID=UPI0025DC4F41|nr:phospholipase D-like domain-containing protein [Phenylobacterium sp.]MCA3719796.1 restriction endonuclease [Phenylobacterium sp.]